MFVFDNRLVKTRYGATINTTAQLLIILRGKVMFLCLCVFFR